MIVVTSIREDMEQVTRIFEQAEIPIFSVSETTGYKTGTEDYLPDEWFGSGPEGTKSWYFFSFTSDEKAARAIGMIRSRQAAKNNPFPIRGFVLPVESTSMD